MTKSIGDITADWESQFSSLRRVKTRMLARRVGPLIHGVCLDLVANGTAYFPTSFIHSLCNPNPAITLTLAQRLRSRRTGSDESISLRFHENHFVDAAARLCADSVLPFDGALSLRQLAGAVERYRGLRTIDSEHPIFLFQDVVVLAAYLGDTSTTTALLERYSGEVETWPGSIVGRWGGVDGWRNHVMGLCRNRPSLAEIVESEIVRHKLQKLCHFDFTA